MAVQPSERRREKRETVIGHLWLVDQQGSTVVRCRCLDMSPSGLRVQAPLGYGLGAGRTYRLCSHPPGSSAPTGLGLQISRPGTVVRADVLTAAAGDTIELGIELAPRRDTEVTPPPAAAAHA